MFGFVELTLKFCSSIGPNSFTLLPVSALFTRTPRLKKQWANNAADDMRDVL